MIWNEKANTARVGERFMVSSVSELAGKLWAQKKDFETDFRDSCRGSEDVPEKKLAKRT